MRLTEIFSNYSQSQKNLISRLDLSFFQLEKIPPLLEAFTNLTELNLEGNNLTTLEAIPSFPHLQKLELSKNKIAGLSSSFFERFPKLSYLHLHDNLISVTQQQPAPLIPQRCTIFLSKKGVAMKLHYPDR